MLSFLHRLLALVLSMVIIFSLSPVFAETSSSAPPDFTVEDIGLISPDQNYSAGALFVFHGIIKNQGADSLLTILTRLRLDENNDGTWDWKPQDMNTGPLFATKTEKEEWTGWTAKEGTHTVEICTDSGVSAEESNENNNCKTYGFIVSAAPKTETPSSTSTSLPSSSSITPTITPSSGTNGSTRSPATNDTQTPSSSTTFPGYFPQIPSYPSFQRPTKTFTLPEKKTTIEQPETKTTDSFSSLNGKKEVKKDELKKSEQKEKFLDMLAKKKTSFGKNTKNGKVATNVTKEKLAEKKEPEMKKEPEVKKGVPKDSSESCEKTMQPVCGTDGKTYSNRCIAEKKGVQVTSEGICKAAKKITQTITTASKNAKKKKGAKVSTQSSAGAPDEKTFVLGPGIDREIFFLTTGGSGTLTISATWTGDIENLQMEISPLDLPEKKNNNSLGKKKQELVFLENMLPDPSDLQENLENTENIFQSPYVLQKTGTSPLNSNSFTLDGEHYQHIKVTLLSLEDGEATGSISFSGTGSVTKVEKKALPQLDEVGKILIPLVMHQLDRKFQNLPSGEKTALDLKFDTNLDARPQALLKMKSALLKYKSFSPALKQNLFNADALAILDQIPGQALSSNHLAQFQSLIRPHLPPITPTDLTATVTLTDPDAPVAGKQLNMIWLHDDPYEDGFEIERGSTYDLIEQQSIDPGNLQFTLFKDLPKTTLGAYLFQEILAGDPEKFCYRVKAYRKLIRKGKIKKLYSGYSDLSCPEYQVPQMQYTKYHLKWTSLKAIKESDIDGFSNSDEPYLIFSLVNGLQNGAANTWTRRWTGADDVDSGETEPDGNDPARFTLFGKPPEDQIEAVNNLEKQYKKAFQQKSPNAAELYQQFLDHPWNPLKTVNSDLPDFIDLSSGLIVSTTIMEHDDGASVSLEEQIEAGIDAALDVGEAVASPDPVHVAIAIKSTAEFLYTLWANDDYVGMDVRPISYFDAWSLAPPLVLNATPINFTIDGGSTGKYKVKLCIYPDGTPVNTVTTSCKK